MLTCDNYPEMCPHLTSQPPCRFSILEHPVDRFAIPEGRFSLSEAAKDAWVAVDISPLHPLTNKTVGELDLRSLLLTYPSHLF